MNNQIITINWNTLPERYQYEVQMLIREFYPFAEFEDGGCLVFEINENGLIFNDGSVERTVFFTEDPRYQGDPLKNAIKKAVYDVLSEVTGLELPWGILTGVRPSKIAYTYLEEGRMVPEIIEIMTELYRVREDKAILMTRTAKTEQRLLKDHHGEDISIYVGIPFCPTRCSYCSFVSYDFSSYKTLLDDYVDALIYELKNSRDILEGRKLQSFYMGGGTPTILSPDQLRKVLSAVDEYYGLANFTEVTVEAGRPDTITRDKLQVLRDFNVSRISINPQTMNQETLDLVGRRHTVEQIREAFAMAREMGFDNINMDFILGLPGEDASMVRRSMEEVIKLDPDNLTIHTLAIKRASRLHLEGKELDLIGKAPMMDESLQITQEAARTLHMIPYYMYRQKNMAGNFENVGYSKAGKECIYNIEIMEERQSIVAFGAGASTKIYFPEENRLERAANVKNVTEYINRIDEMIDRKRKGFLHDTD